MLECIWTGPVSLLSPPATVCRCQPRCSRRYLAGSILGVADILCAYGVSTAWPEGANGFTTAEVKCNFVGTLREGDVEVRAQMLHGGRTTQVWDATVTNAQNGKLMAAFRCTQIILYPRT